MQLKQNVFTSNRLALVATLVIATAAKIWAQHSFFDWQDNNRLLSVVDHAGNVISYDFARDRLVKTDSSNHGIWELPLPPGEIIQGRVHAIIVDSSDNIYINGMVSQNRDVPANVKVIKIAPTGGIQWMKAYQVGVLGSGEHSSAGPLLLTHSGNIYVMGHDGSISFGPWTTILFLIRHSDGEIVNQRTVPGSIDPGFDNSLLALDPSGNVYYGCPTGLYSYDELLKRERWNRSAFGKPVRAIAFDSAGHVFVTGGVQVDSDNSAMYTARLDPNRGRTVWYKQLDSAFYGYTYPLNVDNRDFGGNAIAVDSQGYIYSAGYGHQLSSWLGGIVLKYDPASGEELNDYYYGDNFANSAVFDLKIDSQDNVYWAGRLRPFDGTNVNPTEIDVLTPSGDVSQFPIIPDSDSGLEIDSLSVEGNGWIITNSRSYYNTVNWDSLSAGYFLLL